MRRQVVCLCGSGRFTAEIQRHAHELSLGGYVVVMPHVNTSESNATLDSVEKCRLDQLHLDKITMADEVLIVCPGGYVGESTARELFFAKRSGKTVTFSHPTEFSARCCDLEHRDFLKREDQFVVEHYRKYGVLSVYPPTETLIDAWSVVDRPAPAPVSLVSRAQAAVPHARRLAESMHAETRELREALVLTLDLLEHAWGVIANAPVHGWGGGEPKEWVSIAQKWRDDYHGVIKPGHPAMALTESLRKQRALKRQIEQIIEMVRSRPTSCRDLVHDVQAHLAGLAPLLSAWPGGVNDGQAEPAEG